MARAPVSPVAALGGRWSDFSLRLLSAAVLAPVALLALWWGGAAWVAVIALLLAGLGVEWAELTRPRQGVWLLPGALLLVAVAALAAGWGWGLALLAAAAVVLWVRDGGLVAFGVPYAGLGGLALLWLRLVPATGFRDTVFLVTVIWATDTGAYLVGRMLGGAKLAPKISPGKTWSGGLGGLAFAGAAGWLLAGFEGRALLAALALSLCAQAGDLLESAIKRKLGVKDSGRTIPGHGGLFDRLDGFLSAGPLAAILAWGVQGGLPLWR